MLADITSLDKIVQSEKKKKSKVINAIRKQVVDINTAYIAQDRLERGGGSLSLVFIKAIILGIFFSFFKHRHNGR